MRPLLFLAAAAALASALPALALPNDVQIFSYGAQYGAFGNDIPRDHAPQCFNGLFISGADRSGDDILYVQGPWGAIYRLRLTKSCAALNAARKLTVRSNGSDMICPGDAAETIAWTAAGSKRCGVNEVHRVTEAEAIALSKAPRR
jgi:hypothetical protein